MKLQSIFDMDCGTIRTYL